MPRILPVLLGLTACAASRPHPPLELEWPGGVDEVNPSADDHALALFADDEWNHALACPDSRAPRQPADPGAHRCLYPQTAALTVGGRELRLAAAATTWEWDGMYGLALDIVVLDGARVIATITGWDEKVHDCRASLLQRRARAADLDGDGAAELCVESIDEVGPGLFAVMDQGERGEPWRPTLRRRSISAWRLAGGRLVPAAALAGRCPTSGYRPLVAAPLVPDAVAGRREVQGDDPAPGCRGVERDLCSPCSEAEDFGETLPAVPTDEDEGEQTDDEG